MIPTNKNERILLTGGSGFIGRAVLRALISDDRRPLVAQRHNADLALAGSYDVAELDLTDHAATERLVREFSPELVIHLAGTNMHDDPTGKSCDELNFHATASLLENLAANGARRAIILGSAAEYGDSPTPFTEDMIPRPVSAYARSKAKASEYAMDLFQRTGFAVTVLRVFTVYGPGQPTNMFVSQLVRYAILNKHFNMSDGTQKRDLVYVDDVADAVLRTARSADVAGRIINIASGMGIELRQVAKIVWDKCGAKPGKLHIGALGRTGDDSFDTIADIRLAAELLNWRPTTLFKSGVEITIAAAGSTAAPNVKEGSRQ